MILSSLTDDAEPFVKRDRQDLVAAAV
jgi:hypothetical protein